MIFCFYKIAVSFQVIFVLFLLTFQRTNRDSIGGDYLIWQLKIFLWSFKTHILNYPPLIKWGGIEKLKYCLSNGTLKQLTIVFALLIYMFFNYYPSPPPPPTWSLSWHNEYYLQWGHKLSRYKGKKY